MKKSAKRRIFNRIDSIKQLRADCKERADKLGVEQTEGRAAITREIERCTYRLEAIFDTLGFIDPELVREYHISRETPQS